MICLGGHFPPQSWTLHNAEWSWTELNIMQQHWEHIWISFTSQEWEGKSLFSWHQILDVIFCYILANSSKVDCRGIHVWNVSLSLWYICIFFVPSYRLNKSRKETCKIKRRSLTSEETVLLCFRFFQYFNSLFWIHFFTVKGRRNIPQPALCSNFFTFVCLTQLVFNWSAIGGKSPLR